ncbi:J domain-containing protein [Mesoterricola sediminis]|uniref:J domain-containing protein n=1 Tax=Mesoterricola sediminis TaxID=2927980 RepID=A0AA48GYU7_9BACT|nr:J domain-containing protein [Mesoterricola sediminis]BDU76547.1 hypothetical protein METESE_15050 [Mesoterricola sediminis]
MNPYDVLEISPGARPEEVKAAYHRLAKQWHPDRFTGEAKAAAEQRFRLLAEAFNMLKDATRREEPSRPPEPAVPEPELRAPEPAPAQASVPPGPVKTHQDWFKDALGAYEGKAYERSLALVTYAIRLDGGQAEYHALLGKLLDQLQQDPRGKVKALETAIRLNPKDAESTILLAQSFQALGMQARATRLWETAFALAPRHPVFRQGTDTGKGKTQPRGAQGRDAQPSLGEQWTALVEGTKDKLGRLFKRG